MIHECNVNCRSMSSVTMEALGMEDPGTWLPFFIDLSEVYGGKLSSKDVDEPTYDCTTIFCYDGDAYIIDTPFREFKLLFLKYKTNTHDTK